MQLASNTRCYNKSLEVIERTIGDSSKKWELQQCELQYIIFATTTRNTETLIKFCKIMINNTSISTLASTLILWSYQY